MTSKNASALIEPNEFEAHEFVSFCVRIRPGNRLKAGTTIECQLPNSFTADRISPSYPKQWQTEDANADHFVRAHIAGSSSVQVALEIKVREFVGGYDCPTRHGRCFCVRITEGEVACDSEIVYSFENTTAPWLANQNPGETEHEGLVFVRVDGNEVRPFPSFRVLPGPMNYQRVIVPSSASPGESFRIQLVSLDKFNNLSCSRFDGVDIQCGEKVIAKGLFYVGRGEVTVSLPEEGIYRFSANGVLSNPIRISTDHRGPYWGDIHFHNYPSVDAMGNIPYEYARNVSCLDFAATAEHSAVGLPTHWAQVKKWCRDWHEPGRFVTFLAVEASAAIDVAWHLNAYHYTDNAPSIPAQANGASDASPDELAEYLHTHGAIAQLHHTGWGFDMRKRYPDETRLIEIYSMHGCSELYDPESPLSLESQRHRPGDDHKGPYYVRDAWALGQRFMVHGSSDNHFGQPGVRYNSITGVYATKLERRHLLERMKAGHCYATTGERILLEFSVNEHSMGAEFKALPDDDLQFRLEVHGTGELEIIEVFRAFFIEGEKDTAVDELRFAENDPLVNEALRSWETVFSTEPGGQLDFEATWRERFSGRQSVYYARVRQKDPIRLPSPLEGKTVIQERPVSAWTSPIWIVPDQPNQ